MCKILFCTFLCPCFARLQREASRNLFYGGNVVRVLVHFFSLPLINSLHWWPLVFLILSPPLQNFHVVLPTKRCLLCFLSLALDLCHPFSVEFRCPATFSLFLCLSHAIYPKFVDMTINLSFILWKTRIQKQFPLSGIVFIDLLTL